MNDPGRKWMLHNTPMWVDPDASDYFITICCQKRGANQLCLPGVASTILSAAHAYRDQQKWFPSVFLLMPDHLHTLVGFAREHAIHETIGSWKRYVSRHCGIVWQRNFFEHRLRSTESADEKASYIMRNPVRAGLVQSEEDWPYVLKFD